MKFLILLFIITIKCQEDILTPEQQIQWMKNVKKYMFRIPKRLEPQLRKLKEMNIIKKQKPIVLPKWVDVEKLNPPFYRELQQLKGKERELLVEILEPLTTPLVKFGGMIAGFLPPILPKIFKTPFVYGYFGFLFVWFLFERVSFLRRFKVIKYGYVDHIKDQLAEKARIWAEQYKKYVQEKTDAQLALKLQIDNEQEKQEILRNKIDKCFEVLDLHESMLSEKMQEFNGIADSLKYLLEQYNFFQYILKKMNEQFFHNQNCPQNQKQKKSFFVSFQDVCATSCLDENQYTSKKMILNDRNFQWESEKFPSFPLTIVLRLKERVYLDFCIAKAKPKCQVSHIQFYIADMLDQFEDEPSFRYIGEAFDIKNEQQQIKLQGIGNVIKLIIYESEKKSNVFKKVGFELFKIWGQTSPIGVSKINNQFLTLENQQNDVQDILISQGIFQEYDQINNKFWIENNYQQIDKSTKATINALLKKKQELIQNDDFHTVKLITKDLKQVLILGQEIYKLECEIKIQYCKQNFDELQNLKQKIEELSVKRDYYDMLYETEIYEQMIIMEDEDDFDEINMIKQQINNNFQQNQEIQYLQQQKENTPIKQTPIKNTPIKKSPVKSPIKQKKLPTKNLKKVIVKEDNFWTKGDRDLEKYFKFDTKQQEQVFLKQLQGMNIENKDIEDLFGRKIWGCLNSDSWKLRKKAAEAIYNYIKSDKNGNPSKNLSKYKSKTNLFKGLCQTLLIILNDKIHQIFMVGVDIMEECFSKNICDDKISKQIFTNYLSKIVNLLIERSQIINKKIQVQTINSLLNLFVINNFDLKILIKEMQKFVKEKDRNGEYIQKDFEKIPKYKIFALLQIFYNSFSIQPNNDKFLELFETILLPCLNHSDMEIKEQTINLFELIYPYHPEECLNYIENCNTINKFVFEKLDQIIAEINQKILKEKQDQSVIKELTEEESQENQKMDQTQENIINIQLSIKNKKI